MKVILANKDKSLGLVVPETEITEIGIFSVDLLLRQIESIQSFHAFSDDLSGECYVVKLAFTKDGMGRAAILMRDNKQEGDGWIALCNRMGES